MKAKKLPYRRRVLMSASGLLAAVLVATGCSSFAGYDLPPERAKYTHTLDRGNIHTEWEFWSSEVTEDDTPEGYRCAGALNRQVLGAQPEPCRAEPLIFIRYDTPLGLDNSVRAPGASKVTIVVDRQAPHAPPIAGLEFWTSVDDGERWKPERVNAVANQPGVYSALVTYPPIYRTTGSVSLRAHAWDNEGNSIKQTITGAYFLRSAG